MKEHLNDGQIRAALDNELGPDESHHLESCPVCQDRQNLLNAQAERTAHKLAILSSNPSTPEPVPSLALEHFYHRKVIHKEISPMRRLFSSTAFRIGLAVLALLALILAIPSTRALADQVLSLFRIKQVTVIPVDFTGLQQLTGNDALVKQISELLSSSISMDQKPGQPLSAADAADASQKAGFNVRLPQGMAASSIRVEGKLAFTLQVDRFRAQALLDEAGRSDLVLPPSIDGADISVSIPASVSAAYGTCPDLTQGGTGKNGSSSQGRRYPDCVIFAQLPSPTVDAPADVDVAQLAQMGLEFTGMSPEQAEAFTRTVDWTSSLVIPIPKNGASYTQLTVDGVTGTLIQRSVEDAPQFALIWVKNGIVYAVAGLGSNASQALQIASSLP